MERNSNPFIELDSSIKEYIDQKFKNLEITIKSAIPAVAASPRDREQPRLISSKQTAEMFGMSWPTLRKFYVDTLILKPIITNNKYFFNKQEVVEFIESNTKGNPEFIKPQLGYRGRK